MSVAVNTIDGDTITVNDKEVTKDMHGHWTAKEELTTNEYREFRRHIATLNRKHESRSATA